MIMHEAMIYLISRSVPRELQPSVVVLALAGLPLPWTQILGIPEPEVIGLLSEFYLGRADLLELSGLSGGVRRGLPERGRDRRPSRRFTAPETAFSSRHDAPAPGKPIHHSRVFSRRRGRMRFLVVLGDYG